MTTSLEAEDAVMELLAGFSPHPPSAWFNIESGASLVSVFSEKPFPAAARKTIAAGLKWIAGCGLAVGAGKIQITRVRREDWAESWKKHFHPLEIGPDRAGRASLLVKPSWSRRRPRKNQAVIILDPGLSFGTGHHPTTSFCLGEIVRASHGQTDQKSVLDIGTGSGILALAAAKLGCHPVQAFDFDPEAVRIARANAQLNGVASRIRITRGDVTRLPAHPAKQFTLVCANLISNLLIAERKKITAQLRPGGTLVLAGILATEFGEVQRAFESLGLHLVSARTEKEWRSGAFRK